MTPVVLDTGIDTTEAAIREQYPRLIFSTGSDISDHGFGWRVDTPQPGPGYTRGPNELVNGRWQTTWAPPSQQWLAEQFMAECTDRAQQRLDAFAQSRGYDSIVSLCSYATSGNANFAAEGQRGVLLRDQTWQALIDIKAAVIAGDRAMPESWEAVEAELPELKWHEE